MSVPVDEAVPTFAQLGRDLRKVLKPLTLIPKHGLTFSSAQTGLTCTASWAQTASGLAAGELELGLRPRPDLSVVLGTTTSGTKRIGAELSGLLPGLVVTARSVAAPADFSVGTAPASPRADALLLGLRFRNEALSAELAVDASPQAGSQHIATVGLVSGWHGMLLGLRTTLALTPVGADTSAAQYLVGYDVAALYRLKAGELFAQARDKLNKVELGWRMAVAPWTETAASMRINRKTQLSTLRMAIATQHANVILRSSVDTKGRLRASASIPVSAGGAVATITTQVPIKQGGAVAGPQVGFQLAL